MADPFTITLVARAAYVVNGSGPSVDIGQHRNAAKLTIDVSALSGTTPALSVEVQTSQTGDAGSWITRKTIPVTLVGALEVVVTQCRRYVRAIYTLSGGTPSFTFEIAGHAHQIYAQPDDMRRYAGSQCRLDRICIETLEHACFAATDQANESLARRFTLPLTAYPDSLTRNTALIAVWDALSGSRGDIDVNGPEGVPAARAVSADQWLQEVGAADRSPTGFVDSTPEKLGQAPRVHSGQSARGWYED